VTRTYADWKTITDDINARVWEGVHFRTSDIKGVDQGLRVARWEVARLAEIGLVTLRGFEPAWAGSAHAAHAGIPGSGFVLAQRFEGVMT
jgi:hypothetical protein